MEIIQNTQNTFQPNIAAYYKTIQQLPNVLSFDQLLEKFEGLEMLHNPSYFRLLEKWENGTLSHPPFVFGLESGAFFSAGSIIFLYENNGEKRLKQMHYRDMSMYLGNKESRFTNFLISKFSKEDWKVISDFSNYFTNENLKLKATNEEYKSQMLLTLLEFKAKLADQMTILEFDDLLMKYNNFKLFESDDNWNKYHWYKRAIDSWENGKKPNPPILFGLESGLMFGQTGFIYNYGKDRGENDTKRYYQKTDYRNINHPEFENRVGIFLTENELEILTDLGGLMKRKASMKTY